MQLLELMPHFTRLLPMADRYLSSRSTRDEAHEAMLQGVAESVRTDLGRVAKAHVDASARLDEFAAHVGTIADGMGAIAVEARAAREMAEQARAAAALASNHAAEVEAQMRSLRLWVRVGLVLVVALLLVLVALVMREHQPAVSGLTGWTGGLRTAMGQAAEA